MKASTAPVPECSGSDLQRLGQIATHDLFDVLLRQALKHFGVGDRVGKTLGVRKVRAEDDSVGADGLDEANGVLFEEGVDPDVPT